jgi:hypothetical protein
VEFLPPAGRAAHDVYRACRVRRGGFHMLQRGFPCSRDSMHRPLDPALGTFGSCRKSRHEADRRSALILGCARGVPGNRICRQLQSKRSGRPRTTTSTRLTQIEASELRSCFAPARVPTGEGDVHSLRRRRSARPGHTGEAAPPRRRWNPERGRPSTRQEDGPSTFSRGHGDLRSSAALAMTRARPWVVPGWSGM